MSQFLSRHESSAGQRRAAGSGVRGGGESQPFHVFFYTAPTAMQRLGGGEVQLLKTAEYLEQLGLHVHLFDPWHDRLNRADWLHLFGTLPECLAMAREARRLGVRIALSPISWYDPWVSWKLEPTLVRKCRGVAGWAARRYFPFIPSWRRELIHMADVLLPNSRTEARQLELLFGADRSRIHVVPNGVDARFADGTGDEFCSHFGVRDFVLLPGRIEPRKNQLAVLLALWGTGIPVVVLGDPHPDHKQYFLKCIRAADPGVTFVGQLDHESSLLASAYAAARVVVLASWFETPGLAALEGSLAGARVVVTERGCAREYFGDAAAYVKPNDLMGIRTAIREAFIRRKTDDLCEAVLQSFLWDTVARKTFEAYQSVEIVQPAVAAEPLAAAA